MIEHLFYRRQDLETRGGNGRCGRPAAGSLGFGTVYYGVDPSKGARAMGPTAREWLGAGLLALILVGLIIVLVAAGASGAKPAALALLLA
jgi:hypothetical protein